MSGYILCQVKRAKNPYYISNISTNIYSIEELCYYLYHNIYLLDETIINEQLLVWMKEELHLRRLYQRLYVLLEEKKNIGEFILPIFKEINYLSHDQFREMNERLKRFEEQPEIVRKKIKGDYLVDHEKYINAIQVYQETLKDTEENETNMGSQFTGSIYNNMGCAYASLFQMNEALTCFQKANEELHSVGLGAMNLHGFFAKNFIMYESREALDFCNVFFMIVNYYSIEKSMEIARDRNKRFKDFEKSEYAKGTYFDKYTEHEYMPKTEKVKELFDGIHIPTKEDWEILKGQVMKNGMYHAYRMAIAPNQSTSYILSSTASVMPIVDTIEVREYGDSTTFYPMPYLTNDNYFFYKSAYDMDQKSLIKLISVIQRHVDQGISTILYTNSSDNTRDLAKYYVYAHKMGLKSLYYTRTRKATIDECVSCAV